jgi:transcriptional regulator with XRE-family HTH domain
MKDLYIRIKLRREQLGYTQRYIADSLEIDAGHYSRIESGKVDITISRLVAIARFLEITPSELLASSAMPPAKKIVHNPKVTLSMDLDDVVKADIVTLAFGDRVFEITNK